MKWIGLAVVIVLVGCAEFLPDGESKQEITKERLRLYWGLEKANTVSEISRLFGSGPISCVPSGVGKQVCTWVSGKRTTVYFKTKYVLIPKEKGTITTAVCELPLDGSKREPNSCQLSYDEPADAP